MSRRSPTNARYQKYQEPAGKTRKSAAAAKPSRKPVNPNAPSPKESGTSKSRMPIDPQTPEFKALRKSWAIALVAATVLVLISLGARLIGQPGGFLGTQLTLGSIKTTYLGLISSVTLGLGYACLGYGLYLDFYKIRPLRLAYAKAQKLAEKPAKPSKKDSSKD